MLRSYRKKKGFSLVEITITVGIIVLLAALSIHTLIRIKINTNDGAVDGNVKSVATALEAYRAVNSNYTKFFDTLISAVPPYLSNAFVDGDHQGYDFFIITSTPPQKYVVYAQPNYYGITGTKFVIYDSSGLHVFDFYEQAGYYVTGGILTGLPPAPPGYGGP
jgi:prepilin-type N-terminal cleavage/methylation domain-containing protein